MKDGQFNSLMLIALLFLVMAALILPRRQDAEAQQFAVNYFWADSLSTSTAAVDTLFPTEWYQIELRAVGQDVFMRIGAPDTTDWSSREWIRLVTTAPPIVIGPATKVKRLEYKSAASTGALFMFGYKRTAQF